MPQEQQQQQSKPSYSTSVLDQAGEVATKAANQQQIQSARPTSNVSSGVNAAVSSATAAQQKHSDCAQQSNQVMPQAVSQSPGKNCLHLTAPKLSAGLPSSLQPRVQESHAQHCAAGTSRNCLAEPCQSNGEFDTGALAKLPGKGTAMGMPAPKSFAAAQKQGSRHSTQQKRPLVALQSSEGQAVKRLRPACDETASKASHQAQKAVSRMGPAVGCKAPAEADPKRALQQGRQLGFRAQKGKAAKSDHSPKAGRAGKACTAGKARQALPLPHGQPVAVLADAQPVRRQGLRVRKAASAVVNDTSDEEDGSMSEYADPSCTAEESGDDLYKTHNQAGFKPARMARLHRRATAAAVIDSSSDNINQRQSQQCGSSPDEQKHQDESAAPSSVTEDDSDADIIAESPEQADGKPGKSSRAPVRGRVQRSAGTQRAKHDSAGSVPGAASSSRGGHRRAATRQNFVRCNLKASLTCSIVHIHKMSCVLHLQLHCSSSK